MAGKYDDSVISSSGGAVRRYRKTDEEVLETKDRILKKLNTNGPMRPYEVCGDNYGERQIMFSMSRYGILKVGRDRLYSPQFPGRDATESKNIIDLVRVLSDIATMESGKSLVREIPDDLKQWLTSALEETE